MKIAFIILCFCFILCGCTNNSKQIESNEINMSERLISISETVDLPTLTNIVTPAIVGISSVSNNAESVGAGVCVSSGGYILTNAHVITNPNNITLHLSNEKTTPAKLVFSDSSLDIAILKSNSLLPYLPLADSGSLKVGEDVIAVGTPISLLLKHSFTKGIISALNRTLYVSSLSGESYMQNLIQHDASLNPGNSGGPLINLKGEIVGINTLKISSGEGIGFAIPVKSFNSLLSSINTKINYTTPYLGIYGYDAEIANYYDYTDAKNGVYVIDIASNSPLINTDLKPSMVITKINNTNINNYLDFRDVLYTLNVGDTITINYINNNMNYQTSCKLASHPINTVTI